MLRWEADDRFTPAEALQKHLGGYLSSEKGSKHPMFDQESGPSAKRA